MKKLLLIPLLLGTLQAQNFEQFLAEALQKSPLLQRNALSEEQVKYQSELSTRYKNPTLSLEVSNFDLANGESEVGFGGGISQPIRLWGVSGDRASLAEAQTQEVKSSNMLTRAAFVRELSAAYAQYKNALSAERLAKEELLIAQKIASISKSRFESGTIARVKYLQASLEEKRVKNFLAQASLKKGATYYQLIGFSGINEERSLESEYSFRLSTKSEVTQNASIALSQASSKKAKANAMLNANKLEWIDLYGSYEQEPDQDIARVGLNIPLVLFNTKSQEKEIATLQAKKSELLTKNLSQKLHFQLKSLKKSIEKLQEVEQTSKALLESQAELLAMYEEGYKIANIDLIELQAIKNQLIETKENLLKVTLKKELNIIQYNYLTGTYNE